MAISLAKLAYAQLFQFLEHGIPILLQLSGQVTELLSRKALCSEKGAKC